MLSVTIDNKIIKYSIIHIISMIGFESFYEKTVNFLSMGESAIYPLFCGLFCVHLNPSWAYLLSISRLGVDFFIIIAKGIKI